MKGFIEQNDFEAVRSHLPEAFQGPVTFAYRTGWRVSNEILPLKWKQVDFTAGTVRLEPGTTKSGEGRTVPFGAFPELASLLRTQWEKTLSLKMETGQTVLSVFHWNDRGTIKSIHPKALYHRWQIASQRAGVPTRILHDLRLTAIRNLAERRGRDMNA